MSDADTWLSRARAIVEATRPLLDNYGLAPDPGLTVALDGHPCPGYRHDTGQILFCPPVVESGRDRLRWLFFCRVMGCADLDEAVAFYEVALPLIVCHELAHHLRYSLGVAAESSFIEEQVCDRIAVALVERMPAHAATLAPLWARCRPMRARLGAEYEGRAGAQFLPGLGEALVARAELDEGRLAALEALAAGSDAPLLELLEVAVGRDAVEAARASRDEAQVMVDSRYTEDPSEYWYLSLTWVESYLGRPRAVDLQDVVRDHLQPHRAAPARPRPAPPAPTDDAARASLARCGEAMALRSRVGEGPVSALARRQLLLDARRAAADLARGLAPPAMADAVAALVERGDPAGLAALSAPWRGELERALRGEGYPAGETSSPLVRAALARAGGDGAEGEEGDGERAEDGMLTSIEKTLALESVALFAHLPPDQLWRLAERAVDEVVDPGEAVFREGEEGRRLFLVLDGSVRIEKQQGEATVELAVLGPGASFGEMALFDGHPRSATARAVGPGRARVLSVDRHVVARLGRENPEIYEALLRALSERLRATSALIDGERPTR